MMAVVGSRAAAQEMCARFRVEASRGRVGARMEPGHRDGWGIAFLGRDGALHHAGRSTRDAETDPEYPRAVERLAQAVGRGVVLDHLRKVSLGAKTLENTHPFLEGGFAFCHNGTVRGVAPPGENDSRALFARLLAEMRKGASPEEAIATLARDVDRSLSYTSLTFLLTDGRSLWGLRRVGNDPVACAPEACAPEYYTLGWTTLPDGSLVVSQEHEVLGIQGWTPVADGEILAVTPDGKVSTRRAL